MAENGMGQTEATDVERADMDTEELRQQVEELDARTRDAEAVTDFLVALRLPGPHKERLKHAHHAAAKARALIETRGRGGLNAFDAERATAYATSAIADVLLLAADGAFERSRPDA